MSEILSDLSTAAMLAANEANHYASMPFSFDFPGKEVYEGDDICWCFTGVPLLPCNVVFKAHLKPEDIDGTIESLTEKARSRNVFLRWYISGDTEPADLEKYLEAHGFTGGAGPMMAIDLREMNTGAPVPPGLAIKEISDEADFEAWYSVVAEGFGIPPERAPHLSTLFRIVRESKKPFHFYLAELDGKPVATSQLFLAEGVAGIYYVATIPEARNQGIGYAVTLEPLLAALDMGYRVGTLSASAMGEPVYRKMGFKECGKIAVYMWRAT